MPCKFRMEELERGYRIRRTRNQKIHVLLVEEATRKGLDLKLTTTRGVARKMPPEDWPRA